MTWMLCVFFIGTGIGLAAGVAWGNAMAELDNYVQDKLAKEAYSEIMRLRAQVADLIGKDT